MFLRKNTFLLLTSLSMTLLTASLAHAETANAVSQNSWTPDHARVLASGAAVSDVRTIGGDGMLPVFGNSEGFAYADFMGDYGSDDTYLVSPGLGYRKVINNQIAGAYFFGDYEKTSLGTNFWVMSPGLEWMTAHWDAHVNGYFPTETTEKSGDTAYLETFGDSSQVSFETHNQYDALAAPYAVIGNGIDAEVGYSFAELSNLRSRVYLGGYYYAASNESINTTGSFSDINDITGVTAGFEQPISKNLSIALFNSYDNVNNYAVGVSLTATFGQDSTVFSNNIHDRLLDPVERHVGIIDTGAGNYDQQELLDEGRGLEYDNVYFVAPEEAQVGAYSETADPNGTASTSTSDIGTYENPAPLTQATLDAIDAQSPNSSRIYVQGGDNANYYINSTTATQSTALDRDDDLGLYVHNGQDIYGRTPDFTAAAGANEQPNIIVNEADYNGFVFYNTQENTLSDVTLSGGTDGVNGVVVANDNEQGISQTLNITHTNILSFESSVGDPSSNPEGISSALYVTNYQNAALTVNITNSTMNDSIFGFNGFNNDDGQLVVNVQNSQFDNNAYAGLSAQNMGTGQVTINATDSAFNNNLIGMDVANRYADNEMNINIASSEFNYNGQTGLNVTNVRAGDVMTVNITDSQFNQNSGTEEDRAGLSAYNLHNGILTMNVTDSQFNDNANGGMYVLNQGVGTVTLNTTNATFNNNVNGLYVGNGQTGEVTITDVGSQFNNNTNDGLYLKNDYEPESGPNSGTITLNATSSQFNGNGLNGLELSNTGTSVISAINSEFNNNAAGLALSNNGGEVSVNSLSGSSFDGNSINGIDADNSNGNMTIDYTGATFADNTSNSNYNAQDNINWIPDAAP